MSIMNIVFVVLQGLMLISFIQTVSFFFIERFKNPGIVDVFWSVGIWALAVFYFFQFSTLLNAEVTTLFPSFLILGLITIWMIRLALHLLSSRIFKGHKDKRYLKMYDKWGDKALLMMWLSCQFQGVLQVFLSISFIFIFINLTTLPVLLLSFVVFLFAVSLGLECIADYQLLLFKKTAKKKDFCQTGLWFYSRHPNYFSEIFIWFSIALASILYPFGYFALIGPIGLYLIMRFMSGAITEKHTLERCGDAYKEYQETTPMILLNILKKK